MSEATVSRTFHIKTDLDRRMDEISFQSVKKWNKTKLVNRALAELLEKPEFQVRGREPILKPKDRK